MTDISMVIDEGRGNGELPAMICSQEHGKKGRQPTLSAVSVYRQ